MVEENNSRPLLTGRTNNGSRHRVRPQHGVNGKTLGGLPKNWKSRKMRQAKACDSSGQPVMYRTLVKTYEDGFQEFNSCCYRWIVYSRRGSTVTDAGWKYHFKWRIFSVQKCAQNGYKEKWWWIDTVWQQDENLDMKWTIRNSGMNMIARWQSMTRTTMAAFMIAWHCTMRTPTTPSTDIHNAWARMVCAHSLIFLLYTLSHHLHTHRGSRAQLTSLSLHPHGHGHLSVSPHLDSPFSISCTSSRTFSSSSSTWSS